jgi:hypothetical protein
MQNPEKNDGSGEGQGHGTVSLPRTAPWVRPEIVANRFVEQVVAAVLGPAAYLNLCGGNMNFPGSGTQHLHMDGTWQYGSAETAATAGRDWPCPCHLLVVQVVFFDTTETNGATEIWPGTATLLELAECNKVPHKRSCSTQLWIALHFRTPGFPGRFETGLLSSSRSLRSPPRGSFRWQSIGERWSHQCGSAFRSVRLGSGTHD